MQKLANFWQLQCYFLSFIYYFIGSWDIYLNLINLLKTWLESKDEVMVLYFQDSENVKCSEVVPFSCWNLFAWGLDLFFIRGLSHSDLIIVKIKTSSQPSSDKAKVLTKTSEKWHENTSIIVSMYPFIIERKLSFIQSLI